MSLTTKLLLGGSVGLIVLLFSARDWRKSVKFAFVLLLVEGAIRRWLVPAAAELVYFAKDGVLLGAYIGYLLLPHFPLKTLFPRIQFRPLFVGSGIVTLSALNPNIGWMPAAALGVKNYLFYFPLIILVPQLFRDRRDLMRSLSVYMLMAFPVCLLGVAQFRSDRFSIVNRLSLAEKHEKIGATTFGTSDYVRITGTFSYLTGHTTFVCFFFAITLSLLFMDDVPFRVWHSYVTLPMLAANALMGGSRASVVTIAFVVVGMFATTSAFASAIVRKRILSLAIAIFVAGIVVQVVFREAATSSMDRLQHASDTFYSRTIGIVETSLVDAWKKAGVIGYGVGTTSPSVNALVTKLHGQQPTVPAPVYDSELAQVLVELGLLGFITWYLVRLWALVTSWNAFRYCQDLQLKPLVLAVTLVSLPFLLMSVVLNHVAGIMLWGAMGLTMIPYLNPETKRLIPASRTSRHRMPLHE